MALTLTACTSGSGEKRRPQTQAPASTSSAQAVKLEGRFFAVAGERSGEADLYELQFSPLRLDRLTTGSRVSAVGGCDNLLVTAAAQAQVGLADTIQAFRNGLLGAIDGLGKPKGFAPTLAADCRLAYTAVDRSTSELTDRLHVWDSKRRADSIVYSAPELAGFDWGPDGRLAVVVNRGGTPGQAVVTTSLVVVAPDGSKKTIPPPAPDLGGLRWGASGQMAIVRVDAQATLLFNPDTGARTDVPGWFPLAWSQDGQQLLLTDAREHRQLAVVTAPNLAAVRQIGTTDLGVFGAVWLSPGASPTGSTGS